jgi:FlaA1/EpsC-like NDP-sugar epimerase
MDEKLKNPSRFFVRNRYVLMVDVALTLLGVLGSFALRLNLGEIPFYFPAALTMMVVAVAVKIPIYYFFGLYRRWWAYASVSELKLIASAVTTASFAASVVMLALFESGFVQPGMPRSALGIDWLLSLVFIGGSRFALRILAEPSPLPDKRKARRALIVGAGDAGALVVREMTKNPQLNTIPIGFLDDDPQKQAHEIYGIPVLGKLSDLAHILSSRRVDEVIVAIPSAPGKVVRMVAETCREKGIPSRTMPGLYELIGGKVSVSRLREVEISDLLRREPAHLDDDRVGTALTGKRVLVTGAGGSIGRELCRQAARWAPAELILLGHGENSIFEALLELKADYPSLRLIPVIADVRDLPRLRHIFAAHRPEVVFHAAAHKHVPLMETNIPEAVTNNVLGTKNLIEVSLESKVARFVLISTDKAVRPSSVYGATKRLSEMLTLRAARQSGRVFTVVRFGNVLGSRGSIIPIFKKQIAQGGPVTVTHPEMRRFFMTIPEAVYLVLQASSMGQGGEVFVLNMGEQVKILDLAKDLIRLSGLEPGRDIEIVFTGIRQGEKLSEELWEEGTPYEKTAHPDIFRLGQHEEMSAEALERAISRLLDSLDDEERLVTLLDEMTPGASIRETPPPPDVTAVV